MNIEFDSVVTACEESKEGWLCILENTEFFPEQGGQTCDRGTLNGIEVKHVSIKNDVIYHLMECPIQVGTKVHGEIDFEHKFRNMQMHSGEHIFSGTAHKLYNATNVGFHLSENSATMDFDVKLDREQIETIEKKVNDYIYDNLPIIVSFPTKEELVNIDYRSKKEIDGQVRLVEIPGVDICACCAPHVERTGEIGLFVVTSFENYKGGVRLNYLAGRRAFEYVKEQREALKSIRGTLEVKSGLEAEAVEKMAEANRNLSFSVIELKNRAVADEIKRSYETNPNAEDGLWIGEANQAEAMKSAMNALHSCYSGVCAAFCGKENEYQYFMEGPVDKLSSIVQILKDRYGAKGGGKPDSVRGKATITESEIRDLFN